MVEDESMAVRFYEPGNAADLAEQLIAILQSPELEYEMAEQNSMAGREMMIGNVVNNYVRWFKLQRCKRTLRRAGLIEQLWPPAQIASRAVDRRDLDLMRHSVDVGDPSRVPESRILTRRKV